jgi:hypothetical protein
MCLMHEIQADARSVQFKRSYAWTMSFMQGGMSRHAKKL